MNIEKAKARAKAYVLENDEITPPEAVNEFRRKMREFGFVKEAAVPGAEFRPFTGRCPLLERELVFLPPSFRF